MSPSSVGDFVWFPDVALAWRTREPVGHTPSKILGHMGHVKCPAGVLAPRQHSELTKSPAFLEAGTGGKQRR